MTQHYQINGRYVVVRDNFGSGDANDFVLYRPHIDNDGYLGSDIAVIDCVESHPLQQIGLDPNAPADAVGLRFMGAGDSLWACQYPTYLTQDSHDDHLDGDLLVTLDGETGNDYPFVDAGIVIGRLSALTLDTSLTEEDVTLINTHINFLLEKIEELGMTGQVNIIQPTPPLVVTPEEPPVEEPPVETPPPTETEPVEEEPGDEPTNP